MSEHRRDIKPDAQRFDIITFIKTDAHPFDKVTIEPVPSWKESEMSGDEWRINAAIKFYRKDKLVKETYSSNVAYASYLIGARHIEACDNAVIIAKKKFDFSSDGHKSVEPSTEYRLFCERHPSRGGCGLDDCVSNYVKTSHEGGKGEG